MELRHRKGNTKEHAPAVPSGSLDTSTAKASPRKRDWCCTICIFIIWAPIFLLALDYGYTRYQKLQWGLIKVYTAERNPDWNRARYRASEQSHGSFNQWYYNMITDAETNLTFSFGFGGFRSEEKAGGWMKVKSLDGSHDAFKPWPETWYPFDHMVAGGSLNTTVYRDLKAVHLDQEDNILFKLTVLDDRRLRYTARFPDLDSDFDITFTRVYGTYSGDEKCHIANLPFAYGSLAQGHFTMKGHTVYFDHSMRYRAYVESTWGCTFPKPGSADTDPITYPWKWMWVMVPDPSQYESAQTHTSTIAVPSSQQEPKAYGYRRGLLKGEVGLVVANARMSLDVAGSTTGTFAFIDLPDERISGVNVTVWDDSAMSFPVILAGAPGGATAIHMTHDKFQDFKDEYGSAFLPAQQNLTVITATHEVFVRFVSNSNEFVRVPVPYKDSAGVQHVCSDFRASQSYTSVLIQRRLTAEAAAMLAAEEDARSDIARDRLMNLKEYTAIIEEAKPYLRPCVYQPNANEQSICLTLVEAVTPHNAVEYAYHAPYDLTV